MAQEYGPFDTVGYTATANGFNVIYNQGDRSYNMGKLAAWMNDSMLGNSGILPGMDNSLACTQSGVLGILVDTGRAMKAGCWYRNTSSLNMSVDAPSTNFKRYDRLVLRLDSVTNRTLVAFVIKGTEVALAGSATIPALVSASDISLCYMLTTNTAGSYSYSLADDRDFIEIGNAQSTILGHLVGNADTATLATLATQAVHLSGAQSAHGLDILTGSGNWVCPANVYTIKVILGGGGGGGGGGASSSNDGFYGGVGTASTFGSIAANPGQPGEPGLKTGSNGVAGTGGVQTTTPGNAGTSGAGTVGGISVSGYGSGQIGSGYGSSGGGGSGGAGSTGGSGGGGGAGALSVAYISTTPGASYAYVNGAGGGGGTAASGATGGVSGATSPGIIVEY